MKLGGELHYLCRGSLNKDKNSWLTNAQQFLENQQQQDTQTMDIDYEREVGQLKLIATLYKKRSLLREAEHVYKTVISLQEKYLGFCHAEVALSCYQLAEVYSDLSQYSLARPLYARAVEIWQNLAVLNLIKPAETVFFMDALTALQIEQDREAAERDDEEEDRNVA